MPCAEVFVPSVAKSLNRMVPVNRLLVSTALLLAFAVPMLADDDEPAAPPQSAKAEKIVNASLPVCSQDMSIKRLGMQHKLPANLVGTVIRADSERNSCKGQWLSIVSQGGDHYFGMPWFLDEQSELPTIEAKLKYFAGKALQLPCVVFISKSWPYH